MSFLTNIKAVPVTDLAERMGFTLVQKGRRYYSLKEHDSVMIDIEKNCFWRNSRFSKGYKGGAGSTIDFVMEFGDAADYKKAMRKIAVMYGIEGDEPPESLQADNKQPQPEASKKPQETSKREVPTGHPVLPEKGKNDNQAFRYLLERGITQEVIKYFLARKMLYEDVRHNCVFVSPKKDFACLRSTGERRFVMDCEGSDYEQCFFFKGRGNASRLIVAESVIDIMSIMSYIQMQGEWYGNYAYLALAGTNKIHSLFVHLNQEPQIEKVILCFDRDEAGHIADGNAIEGLKEMNFKGTFHIKKTPIEGCKDWNDYIQTLK